MIEEFVLDCFAFVRTNVLKCEVNLQNQHVLMEHRAMSDGRQTP